MAKNQLRMSQVVGSYGPGAMVDLPDDSIIVAGLDSWYYDLTNIPTIQEPRLVAMLRGMLDMPQLTLRNPPHAVDADSNRRTNITGYKFPAWYLVQRDSGAVGTFRKRRLVHETMLDKGKFINFDGKRDSVVPIRFVRACPRGHVGEIEWRQFIACKDPRCQRPLWIEERGTSGDLNDIWVRCECGANRAMSEAARPGFVLGNCDGSRPWLGPNTREQCTEASRLLIRSASNAYFAQLLPVISIPDAESGLDAIVKAGWDAGLGVVTNPALLAVVKGIPQVAEMVAGYDDAELFRAIERYRSGTKAGSARSTKEIEFVALAEAREELGSDQPDGDFFARRLPPARWNAPWMQGIESVVLVQRLREVVVQLGFTRFEAAVPNVNGDLDLAVERAPLTLNEMWLPAIENRGEGVFIKFNPEAIAAWLETDAVQARARTLLAGFEAWKGVRPQSKREFPGLPYYMMHSFAHLLITAIALECGYPVSSLRERIYAGDGQYGVLIYTASADAEGTLGGLVSAGRAISRHIRRALEMGALCSNDPICAGHDPAAEDHQELIGSACHGCLLISETSCEQRNDYLDRTLVVSTIESTGAEFFVGAI